MQERNFKLTQWFPFPLHPDRQRERGYNQAELIARPLARRLGLKLAGISAGAH